MQRIIIFGGGMTGFRGVSVWALVCLAVGLGCADATEGNNKPSETKILLSQIWAYDMPGTRPMQDVQRDGKFIADEGPLLNEIRRILVRERIEGTSPIQWKDAGPGFAVLGTGMDALREAHSVLVKKQEPRKSFPIDAEITLVFFSNQFGSYVHLQQVEKSDGRVTILFHFTNHNEKMMSTHFALIPLGSLAPGKVSVEIIQVPEPYPGDYYTIPAGISPEFAQQFVCQSFTLAIQSPDKK